MSCSCLYAQGGENCKHMAAVLFAAENQGDILAPESKAIPFAPQPSAVQRDEAFETFRQGVYAMSLKDLRALVLEWGERDSGLCPVFRCGWLSPSRWRNWLS